MESSNSVVLVGCHGSDETIAQAAWASTGVELTDKSRERIPALLRMLAQSKPRHTVPFEHTSLTFRVRLDMASHVHLLKHRIGVSVSSESARWKERREDLWYVPRDWPDDLRRYLDTMASDAFDNYHAAIKALESAGIDRKRAKETARFFMPMNAQVQSVVTFNFLSFAHFQGLRNHPDAQVEIREVAREMLRQVSETGSFPWALRAWNLDEFVGDGD